MIKSKLIYLLGIIKEIKETFERITNFEYKNKDFNKQLKKYRFAYSTDNCKDNICIKISTKLMNCIDKLKKCSHCIIFNETECSK